MSDGDISTEITPREVIEKKLKQEILRPHTPMFREERERQTRTKCESDKMSKLREIADRLVQAQKWFDVVYLFRLRCLEDMTLDEQMEMEKHLISVKEKAKSKGEFDSVIALLDILANLRPKIDTEKLKLRTESKKYKKLINQLRDIKQNVDEDLWMPEMKVIDAIIERNFEKLTEIMIDSGIQATRVIQLVEDVNRILRLINRDKHLLMPKIERKSRLGKYLTKFLVQRCISKGHLKPI